MEGFGQFVGRLDGVAFVAVVGLVDDDQLGQLQDAPLDALQGVAGAGHGEDDKAVDHVGDGNLGLTDADRFDDDDIKTGGLHHDHGLARRRGTPPSVPDVGDGRM